MLGKSETPITCLGLDSAPVPAGAQDHTSWSHTQPRALAAMWLPQPGCTASLLGGVSPACKQEAHTAKSQGNLVKSDGLFLFSSLSR